MLEFNLFLMDYWYFSVPLFLSIILWFRSETRRGGNRVDCDQLTNLVNKKSALLLDVRPKSEFETGAIAGSVNIPFNELENRNEELLRAQYNPIVLICKMGRNALREWVQYLDCRPGNVLPIVGRQCCSLFGDGSILQERSAGNAIFRSR